MRRLLTLLLSAAILSCSPEPLRVPGAELRSRAEARLEAERPQLLASIGHYGLVFEVPQAELMRFMAQVYLRRAEGDVVPGRSDGVELHAGGVLGLITDYWRPGGRRPRLEDRFPFARGPVALSELYRSQRQQVFLPVPGRAADEIDGRLPDTAQLPRLRLRVTSRRGIETREVDAWAFLATLLRYEHVRQVPWTNRVGQTLTADLLLRRAWQRYRQARSAAEDSEDHSYLHLPELLLAFSRRPGTDLDPDVVKRRFLSQELSRRDFGAYEPSEALAHYADSLGAMLSEAALGWSAEDKTQVRDWLAELESQRFPPVDAVPLSHLAHLVRGLRAVESHHSRLR